MLSQENREKLVMSGLYKCKPQLDWIESFRRDNPYHCINWIFKPSYRKDTDTYYMKDTYWGDKGFELTDENFNKFELIFDFNDVEQYKGQHPEDYDEENIYCVAIGSGGWQYDRKYFIKKCIEPNREKVLQRLREEIDSAERNLKYAKDKYKRVESGELKLEWT